MSFVGNLKKAVSILTNRVSTTYPPELTEKEIAHIELCRPFTMTSPERLYATLSSTKYIARNKIPGAFVECGVWRGGSSMLMAYTLLSLEVNDRDFYLFDTFNGMTEPTEVDRDSSGQTAKHQLNISEKKEGNNIWCIASIEDVQENFSSVGYPSHLVHYVKGDVEETLKMPENLPDQVALLRLDTDWYASTKKELDILFPRLVKGGVCLIDDYGHWEGARRAVDEYLMENELFPLMHVTDYTGRVFVKT
jgi:O-methyltransferase